MATPQRQLTPTDIVKSVLTARTPEQVEALIDRMLKQGLRGDRPIGDRDNNAGTIEMASNPYSALGERVTNSIDAEIELAAVRKGHNEPEDWPEPPTGPRHAARMLFGIPKAGVADLTEQERRKLAGRIVVMLEESGTKERPTVMIEDHGIGHTPGEMPEGVLSLNRSNKLKKPHLHGAYGQGGSATLRFSPFTIFISRKAPDLLQPGEPDLVAWTIAYRDDGDPYKEALPVYRYYVDPDDGVPVFDPAELPDPNWHGTRIIHIEYDLTRYSQAYTQLTNGAWGMFQALFFDPVLPFLIGGRRQIDLDAVKKGAVADDDMSDLVVSAGDSTRVVLGNKVRLDVGPKGNDPEIAWRGSGTVDLTKAHGKDLGRLRVNYWVVRRPMDSTRKSDPTLAYVTADSAVTVTLNGQRHEAERRAWLREKLAFPYLAKNLIVQVDIDELSPPARRDLFSSSRERMVDGPMKALVYDEAVAALRQDTELRRLESEMRDRAMSKGAQEIGDKVRRKLAKYVNTLLKNKTQPLLVGSGAAQTVAPPPRPPRPPSPPRSTDDTNLPNVPTDIRFERDPITITEGKRTTVWVHLDAKNGYLQRHEEDLKVTFTPELEGKVLDVGKSELLAGKSLWTLAAHDDAPLTEGEIEAMLMTPNGLLQANARVRVIAPPPEPKIKRPQQNAPVKGPNITWVERHEWDSEFTEKTVGQVNISQTDTDIRVNRHHRLLETALNDRSLSPEQVKGRAERYLFAMGCGLFRQEYAMRESGSRPSDEQVHAEQVRMAEAVLMAIDDKMLDLDH
jgi:hypothetical protein